MTELVRLILAVLATFRVTELVVVDDGPCDVFLRLRVAAGCYDLGEDGKPKSQAGRLLSCPYCLGMWWAALMAILLWPIGWHTLVYWLAIAGGQAFLQTVGGRQ